MKRPLLVLAGPTAVGKSTIAIRLARLLPIEIVSADSRQIYKLMDIGTVKPGKLEREEVPHYMLDLVYPDESFSAARYQQEARVIIDKIHEKGKIPLIVGGCGLYIRAVTQGIFQGPGETPEIREELRQEAGKKGSYFLYEKLLTIDPVTASNIHPHDLFRIIRALEVYQITGEPISSLRQNRTLYQAPYETLTIGLYRQRKQLYCRIEERCQKMLEIGLVDEVMNLLNSGYDANLLAFKGPAYTQMIEYLRGCYPLEEALYLMQRETKRYAKRQFTWFNRVPDIIWLNLDEDDSKTEEQALKTIMKLVQKWSN